MAEAILDVTHLRKVYRGQKVLDDVSFSVARGEILGLMGASGSGKSTILKLIIGLIKPERGEIRFARQNLVRLDERELLGIRPRIGYVFQHGALFDSLTVEENLAYPLRKHARLDEAEISRRVNERLKMVGMEGTNSLYPSELSGGMLKRAGLARGTMLDPELVLFDEPTSGLDPLNIANFIKQISELRKGRALSGIFVSHNADSLLAICERVAILWNGRIRALERARNIRRSADPVVRAFIEPEYEEASRAEAS